MPFHIARFFRPTVLSVYDLSNADLGDIFAVYGVVAMLAYFPGGIIADHFSTRRLMTVSLLATALGGLYMATSPSYLGLSILFAYWGLTSILLFWAALIRATREWGGNSSQGKAFGLLDGGRGLAAALMATVAVLLVTFVLPEGLTEASDLQRKQSLQLIIYFYTGITVLAAILVWVIIPEDRPGQENKRISVGIRKLSTVRHIWLQAAIVVCAYCGYKGLDNYGVYAVDVLKMNELEAARFTALSAYLRPVSAVAAGFIADHFISSRVIATGFMVLVISYLLLALVSPAEGWVNLIYLNLIFTFCAVFAVRGIYFALLEQTQVQRKLTGSAVGVISVIGFTPDIFFAPVAGRLLDSAPGLGGHQSYFLLLSVIALAGFVAATLIENKWFRFVAEPGE